MIDTNTIGIMNAHKPHIKLITYNNHKKWICFNTYFRGAYDTNILGMGNTPDEAYMDWLIEIMFHGYPKESPKHWYAPCSVNGKWRLK